MACSHGHSSKPEVTGMRATRASGVRASSLVKTRWTSQETTMAGVGSEKGFENDKVIVWNFVLEPGEETPVHTHEHSYMWYAIEGAPLHIYDKDGADLGI